MKTVFATLMIMLIAAPAMAQSKGRHRDEQKTAAQENPAKKKAEEEAYQRALKSIPEPKGKIDPWQNAR